MFPRKDFESAFLKLDRAEQHISQFKGIVHTYVMANIKAMRPEPNPKRWKSRALGAPIPKHTPTIVGDAIHNLRTSLDHAYCALVEANGATVKRHTTFPFHKDGISAESSLNGHKLKMCAPSDAVIRFIVDVIQPFEGTGNGLYGIHQLDIADKHHSLIAANQVLAIERLEIINASGSPTGDSFEDISIVTEYGNQLGAIGVNNGFGAKLKGDPNTTFDIQFGDGQPFERESILSTLVFMLQITRDTIIALAKL